MMHSNLRQTTFHMGRLEDAVGLGRSSAYQIYTSPGKPLGHIGTIAGWATETPANEEEFPAKPADSTLEQGPLTWFRKILFALKSEY
jgi:hypothetical protein